MEKVLFQDKTPEERLEMLQNNCDKVMKVEINDPDDE